MTLNYLEGKVSIFSDKKSPGELNLMEFGDARSFAGRKNDVGSFGKLVATLLHEGQRNKTFSAFSLKVL